MRAFLVPKPKTIELVDPMSPGGGAAQAAPTTEKAKTPSTAPTPPSATTVNEGGSARASTEPPPHFGAAAAAAAPLEVTPSTQHQPSLRRTLTAAPYPTPAPSKPPSTSLEAVLGPSTWSPIATMRATVHGLGLAG